MAFVCQAQEHLQFMGIPITGSLDQFAKQLAQKKGFVLSDSVLYDTCDYNKKMRMLKGSFECFDDCTILVRQMEGAKEASSVVVLADTLKYDKSKFDGLVKNFDNRFGKHTDMMSLTSFHAMYPFFWIVKEGKIFVSYDKEKYTIAFMNQPEAIVRDSILRDQLKKLNEQIEQNQKLIDKIAETNKKIELQKERQTVKEICGIPFGSSYEKTEEMLFNKYDLPQNNSDRTVITYKNKTYGGITFDNIYFLFQSDGIHSYFNGCVFILSAKSLSEAKSKQEMLRKKLSEKYNMYDETDENGNISYIGGSSPIPNDGAGFCIDILKYNSETAKNFYPYAARLFYGRYNFVKEEF
jgi:hypothetical protein